MKNQKPYFEIDELEERLELALWGGKGDGGVDGCCNNEVCPCDDGPNEGGDGQSLNAQ